MPLVEILTFAAAAASAATTTLPGHSQETAQTASTRNSKRRMASSVCSYSFVALFRRIFLSRRRQFVKASGVSLK